MDTDTYKSGTDQGGSGKSSSGKSSTGKSSTGDSGTDISGAGKIGDRAMSAAREAATDLTDQATQAFVDQASAAADDGRSSAARYVGSLGGAAAAAADSLQRDGYPGTAERVYRMADFTNDFGRSLRNYDVRSMIEDAADLVRRNPAASFGVAALAGYALVSLSKSDRSSNSRRS
jgi:hypothetical protein